MKKLHLIITLILFIICSAEGTQKSLSECSQEMEKLNNDQNRITKSLRAGDIDAKQAIFESHSISHRFAQLQKEIQTALPYERDELTKSIDARTQEYLANEEEKLQSLLQSFPPSTQELLEKINQLWPNK